MILHASIVADRPREAAQMLASLLGGIALPLGPGDGTWSAIGPDPIGNMISVLRRGSEFRPVPGDHVQTTIGAAVRHSGFHLLIETPLSETEVLQLAAKSQCLAHRAQHGAFQVIEFWIDDCLLIEVVTPELGRAYREVIFSDELRARLQTIVATGEVKAPSQPRAH
ncbi:MAG TPA: hypothetical protein VEA60_06300 [Allosphingosinicella sp.]|nr:hypothetical protein [Allosphingosinicella sp.]